MALCNLPHGLVVLLLAIPAFSNLIPSNNTGATANATSPFDPFEHLRLRASFRPSEPVCCLVPLSTEPLPTTAEFLSFEEWKSKQREIQAQAQGANQTPSPDAPSFEVSSGSSSIASSTALGDLDPPLPPLSEPVAARSPHFRVPLTDRFNYASLDCSARIHTSHRSARSPGAILSSKKDRYMLSPCSAEPNFVVVELCDDIRIDTVQLANFEFFSGVFRDFKVSVAQTYTSEGQGWIEAGTYRAKNIRGVQSFHPLIELRPFYRYIRVDFLSHYGGEFYCPISLLRVYGLTQMEEWKWEIWQGGSGNNDARALNEVEGPSKVQAEAPSERLTSVNGTQVPEMDPKAPKVNETASSPHEGDPTLTPAYNHIKTSSPELQDLQPHSPEMLLTSTLSPLEAVVVGISPTLQSAVPSQPTTSPVTSSDSLMSGTPTPSPQDRSEPPGDASSFPVTSTRSPNTTSSTSSHLSLSTRSFHPGSSIQIVVPLPSPSPLPSGESIYRTIMNRLAMLETNTTLYQMYVEEQTLQVREALRRLEEDVGRLEGISKAQQHVFLKTMNELELRRRQMEEERWELLNKVNHLADEVILEKRLGIAQLCLLLTVLVFMALTRGSRADAISFLDGTMHRFNGFSLPQRRWTSRSPTPTPAGVSATETAHEETRLGLLSSHGRADCGPRVLTPFPTTPGMRSHAQRPSFRRPSTSRHHDNSRLVGAERPIGRLRRSNLHMTAANVPLSTKRFARSAHIHEVQLSVQSQGNGNENENENENEAEAQDKGEPTRGNRPRSQGKRSTSNPPANALANALPTRACGSAESEAESWVDTEAGSDPGLDSDSTDSEAAGLVKAVYVAVPGPIVSAPPSSIRKHFEGHPPPSRASVSG